MSVNLYHQDEINKIYGMMKRHQETLNKAIHDTDAYQLYAYDNKDKEALLTMLVQRTLWYVIVANRVSYSLQYQETIDFFEVNINDNVESIPCNESMLYRELRSLRYNCYTNDGNIFLSQVWVDAFEALLKALLEKAAKI